MIGQGAAGEPAARLAAHVIAEAVQLDQRRRRLAAEHEELAGVLLDIEQTALRQMHGCVQAGLSTAAAADVAHQQSQVPEVRPRRRRWFGRLSPRRHTSDRTRRVVQGFVVHPKHDDPETMTPASDPDGEEEEAP